MENFLDVLFSKNRILATKTVAKIMSLSFGKLGAKDVKYIWNDLYELRIRERNNISRVFYFIHVWNAYVILDWIIKKDQKLKHQDIKRNVTYKNDYKKRFGIL